MTLEELEETIIDEGMALIHGGLAALAQRSEYMHMYLNPQGRRLYAIASIAHENGCSEETVREIVTSAVRA